jgi:molecular chaperone HtpG
VLFESLGLASRSLPGADISLREWQKHLAVHSIEFNKHEIVVVADSRHPVIQHSIIMFAAEIEREVRDTSAVLRRNPQHILDKYSIELPVRVRPQIRPIGYVYKQMALGLNDAAIMSLLMGDRLYSHPAVAVRELVQNSIDACAVRSRTDGVAYQPQIEIDSFIDESGKRWIRVVDNGIGMDEYVLSEYFLKLGNSYYSSPEFERAFWEVTNGGGFSPISRFGIGIISVFMIGDVLEVRTRAARSPRFDNRQRTVRVEKMGSLAFVTETDSDAVGTTISVRLRPEIQPRYSEFLAAVIKYLQEVVVRPRFDIHVKLARPTKLAAPPPLTIRSTGRVALQSMGVEPFAIDLSRWSERLTGLVILAFSRGADGSLSHEVNGKPLKFIRGSLDPSTFIDGYAGNRFTVNGFRMSIKKISRILGIGKTRIPIAFDVDVVGDGDVVYDVARDRIIGPGKAVVAKAFREAIQSGLEDLGVLSQLSRDTRHVIEQSFQVYARQEFDSDASSNWFSRSRPVTVLDDALLQATERVLPAGDWPKGIHKLVAEQLNISNNLASRAISTLLDLGRITRSGYKKPAE